MCLMNFHYVLMHFHRTFAHGQVRAALELDADEALAFAPQVLRNSYAMMMS